MSVPAAYLGVILIWATTPLAIKWSGEGPGFLFGVGARMVIGVALALLALRLSGMKLWRGRAAAVAYVAVGLGIFFSMLTTYWAAQRIPSGWISVVFGLSPIMTGALAVLWLPNQGLTLVRLVGALLGLGGLGVIFGRGVAVDPSVVAGLMAVLLAVFTHSAGAIWVKRLGVGVPPLALVAGGLTVSTPLFVLVWLLFDGTWPADLPARAAGSIVYLAVVGSLIGFVLYYYVLGRVDATRVALITLVTPVAALLIGHFLNGEPLNVQVWAGAGLIITGLAVFEFGDRVLRRSFRSVMRRAEEMDAG